MPQMTFWVPVSRVRAPSGPPTLPPSRCGRFWIWDGSRKVGSLAIEFFRAIGAEHAAADDDGVERIAAVDALLVDLGPVVADVAAEDIVGEGGVLDVESGRVGPDLQLRKRHGLSPCPSRCARAGSVGSWRSKYSARAAARSPVY